MGMIAAVLFAGLELVGRPVGKTGATYDAEAHTVEARGAAAADLRAPTAEVARVRARRTARAQAEGKITLALGALGVHETLADLTKLLEQAKVEERFSSDGS